MSFSISTAAWMVSKTAVGADAHGLVAVAPFAMHAHAAHRRGERVVVGEHRAAVAVAAERLRRKKAGRGRQRQRADAAVLVGGAEALGGIVEHEQTLGLGDGRDRAVVGGLPEHVDRDDRLRGEPALRAVAMARRQLSGSRLKLASSTSAKTGVAPTSATTSAVAVKVKAGQITASPGPTPLAMRTSSKASVPLEQVMA